MNWWRKLLTKPQPVRLQLLDTRPLARQEDQDDLLELLWRARVQANIRQRQAFAKHGIRAVK